MGKQAFTTAADWRVDKPGHRPADEPRGWDYPLTPVILCVLAFAVAFVAVLAMRGALP